MSDGSGGAGPYGTARLPDAMIRHMIETLKEVVVGGHSDDTIIRTLVESDMDLNVAFQKLTAKDPFLKREMHQVQFMIVGIKTRCLLAFLLASRCGYGPSFPAVNALLVLSNAICIVLLGLSISSSSVSNA